MHVFVKSGLILFTSNQDQNDHQPAQKQTASFPSSLPYLQYSTYSVARLPKYWGWHSNFPLECARVFDRGSF